MDGGLSQLLVNAQAILRERFTLRSLGRKKTRVYWCNYAILEYVGRELGCLGSIFKKIECPDGYSAFSIISEIKEAII